MSGISGNQSREVDADVVEAGAKVTRVTAAGDRITLATPKLQKMDYVPP